jgi:hypothetical protein
MGIRMPPTFHPLIIDVPSWDVPRLSDGHSEPFVIEMIAEDGQAHLVPLTLAAVQRLTRMLASDPRLEIFAGNLEPTSRLSRG